MNNMLNFYDNLDLKYNEIAIAMERIDKLNPGKIKFFIPVLTPNMDSSRVINTTIHQNYMNLQNKDKKKYEIDNITLSNYIYIYLPKELCPIPVIDLTVDVERKRLTVSDDKRYIPAGSKWTITFVGGDITKPQITGRYYE